MFALLLTLQGLHLEWTYEMQRLLNHAGRRAVKNGVGQRVEEKEGAWEGENYRALKEKATEI